MTGNNMFKIIKFAGWQGRWENKIPGVPVACRMGAFGFDSVDL